MTKWKCPLCRSWVDEEPAKCCKFCKSQVVVIHIPQPNPMSEKD